MTASNNKISPQGYDYPKDDSIYHPFYEDGGTPGELPIASETQLGGIKVGENLDIESDGTLNAVVLKGDKGEPGVTPDISVTASSNDTTGIPKVVVTQTGTKEAPVYNFDFTGIKGERGEQGETGSPGTDGKTPVIHANAGIDDTSGTPAVTVTTETHGDDVIFSFAFTGLKGQQGEQGPAGPQGPAGESGTTDAVTDVTLTNENGVYSLSQTKNDQNTEIGTIEVPKIDTSEFVSDVSDEVVQDTENGFSFHTLKQTKDGITKTVTSIYTADKQITGITISGSSLLIHTVDQMGNKATQTLTLPSGGSSIRKYVESAESVFSDGITIGSFKNVYDDSFDIQKFFIPRPDIIYTALSPDEYIKPSAQFTIGTYIVSINNVNIYPIVGVYVDDSRFAVAGWYCEGTSVFVKLLCLSDSDFTAPSTITLTYISNY